MRATSKCPNCSTYSDHHCFSVPLRPLNATLQTHTKASFRLTHYTHPLSRHPLGLPLPFNFTEGCVGTHSLKLHCQCSQNHRPPVRPLGTRPSPNTLLSTTCYRQKYTIPGSYLTLFREVLSRPQLNPRAPFAQ